MKRLRVGKPTASRIMHELRDAGFLVLENEYDFINGQAREYRMTWLPDRGKEPTNEWMKIKS